MPNVARELSARERLMERLILRSRALESSRRREPLHHFPISSSLGIRDRL